MFNVVRCGDHIWLAYSNPLLSLFAVTTWASRLCKVGRIRRRRAFVTIVWCETAARLTLYGKTASREPHLHYANFVHTCEQLDAFLASAICVRLEFRDPPNWWRHRTFSVFSPEFAYRFEIKVGRRNTTQHSVQSTLDWSTPYWKWSTFFH